MDFRKLNEELETFIINELSDKTKQAYLAGRQAQLDKAQKAMEKARAQVKKSDARQIATLPQGIDKETATDALQDLKSEMRRIDSGSDWRLEEQDNEMCLSVRYWGSWHGDDGSGDYDWQALDDQYRDKLDGILTKVQKKYGVQIYEPGSEKNWLDFCIPITKMTKKSTMDYENEKAWLEFIKKNDGADVTANRHKGMGWYVATFKMPNSKMQIVQFRLYIKKQENGYICQYKARTGIGRGGMLVKEPDTFVNCLKAAQDFIDKRMAKKNDPNRKKTKEEKIEELWKKPFETKNLPFEYYGYRYQAAWTNSSIPTWANVYIKRLDQPNLLCVVSLEPPRFRKEKEGIVINFYKTDLTPSQALHDTMVTKKPIKTITIDETQYDLTDVRTWLRDAFSKASRWALHGWD